MMKHRTILTNVLIIWVVLLASTVEVADRTQSLADLSVVDSQRVSPEAYREAAAFAARGNEPLDTALKLVGAFGGAIQHMIQVNEGSESPSASSITVMRDWLMDDSVRGVRWDIALEKRRKMSGVFGKYVGPGAVGVESRQTGLRQIYARNAFDSCLVPLEDTRRFTQPRKVFACGRRKNESTLEIGMQHFRVRHVRLPKEGS